MLLDFFQLKEQPFGVTPNPRFLYLSSSHREALASLCYGVIMGRGLVTLVAPPGMGKTTLLFRLLQHLRQSARTAFLFQTQCDSNGLLRYLLNDLGVNTSGLDFVGMHEQLNSLLVQEARAGRRFVVIIDEAQNLDEKVLETARLLTDFETPNEKLLQIILAGQPQLADKLKRPELVQLRQRISTVCRLQPLSPSEINDYINHRLEVAGRTDTSLFTASAVSMIGSISEGIPRNINNLCFNALSLGYAVGAKIIDSDLIREAANDLELECSPVADPLPEQLPIRMRQVAVGAGERVTPIREDLATVPAPSVLVDALGDEVSPAERSTESLAETAGSHAYDGVESSVPEGHGASGLALEPLELALARDAEILAEVVDFDWGKEDQTAAQLLLTDAEAEPRSVLPLAADSASFSDTDQEQGEGVYVDSPQIILALEDSAEPMSLTISYPATRKFIGSRLAPFAALFVLFLAGVYFRLQITTAALDLRQIIVASSTRFFSRPGPVRRSEAAEARQIAPASTTPPETVSQ
jgi:general secretion pathway protein A